MARWVCKGTVEAVAGKMQRAVLLLCFVSCCGARLPGFGMAEVQVLRCAAYLML